MTPPLSRGFCSPALQPDLAEELLTATAAGDATAVHRLLEQGADADATNVLGFSALHLAAYNGLLDIVTLLLTFGADVNAPGARSSHVQASSFCFTSPVAVAAAGGHLNIVKYLVENRANVAAAVDGAAAPLSLASSLGHMPVVQYLVAAKAPLEHSGVDGSTAVVLAAAFGHLDIVRFLEAHGAQIDPPCVPSIIHRAALHGHSDMVRYLLWHGVQYDGYDSAGFTPLCLAASMGRINVIDEFLNFGVHANSLRCRDGATALHCAVRSGHLPVVHHLMLNGALPNQPDRNGITPLQVAAEQEHSEIVQHLLHFFIRPHFLADPNFEDTLNVAIQVASKTPGSEEQLRTLMLDSEDNRDAIRAMMFMLNITLEDPPEEP